MWVVVPFEFHRHDRGVDGRLLGPRSSPVSSASTSTRGVANSTINVVFPVVSLNSLAGQEGFAQDAEYGEQTKAINFYVKQINEAGGINGRKINPIITTFDPTNETPDAGPVQDLDRGLAGGLRRAGRASATGRGTTSSASPRKATPPSSAHGPR